MIALVSTSAGTFAVDLETDEVEPADPFVPPPAPVLNLPLVIAAATAGSTVVAVVNARPPLVVSYDAGATWNESGRGLPAGRAVAISDESPDTMVYAARNRLYVSRNGGVFWEALALELPEIEAVALMGG
ncbi:MAG TPA: hypothetical protein VG652_08650 [Gaiellaceae bacterium]|nr:hypothetical protein [Gaiellaceae bacterium]